MPTSPRQRHPSSEDSALRSETVARLIRAGFSQADAREEADRIVVFERKRREQGRLP